MTRPYADWVVLLPGVRWDDVPGTDRQLALALAERVEVLWVDPAYPATALLGAGAPRRDLHQVAPHLHRLQPVGPPASSRPGVRGLAERVVQRRLAAELASRRIDPLATVLMTTRLGFGSRSGVRVLFVTDDWVAGASMMGLAAPWVGQRVAAAVGAADVVAAVTPDLLAVLARDAGPSTTMAVVPNGTHLHDLPDGVAREPLAGLVGQLNERLDFAVLTAVADRHVPLLLVGPRTVRDPAVGAQLDALLARDGVTWVGQVPYAELRHHLARVSVGLTPYADSAFNRSSFPLKTLEYLGAGVPVVSTDLPAARWLDTEHVHVAAGAEDFADAVVARYAAAPDRSADAARVDFARGHTWAARAEQLLGLVRDDGPG